MIKRECKGDLRMKLPKDNFQLLKLDELYMCACGRTQ